MTRLLKIVLLLAFAVFTFAPACSNNGKSDDNGGQTPDKPVTGQPPSDTTAFPEPTRPPKKLALLVGINKYRHSNRVSNLAGCVNDVMAMKAILIGKFEFQEENILVLTDAQATHEGIVKAFQDHLIARVERDDIVVFHYSGHGSQMKDISGDEIDGMDETLVPHDSRDPEGKVFDVSDDELNGLMKQLSNKTQNITFIFDSCHSGTASRIPIVVRRTPPDNRVPPEPPAYAVGTRGVAEGESGVRRADMRYALISGCLSPESSFEHYADSREHGALTFFLTEELKGAPSGVTYRDVMQNVMGKVNVRYSSQHPQLEGAGGDNYVFSDSSSIAQPFIPASPAGANKVSLSAGEIQGLTVGSIFEVYKPGTRKFDNAAGAIAKVELTSVSSFKSEGKIISGNQIPDFSRAVERQHQFTDRKLRVYYQGLSASTTLRAIKTELDKFTYIETASEPRGYHLLLRQAGNEIVTEGGDTTEVSPRVQVGADAANAVVKQVSQWAKWFNILSIENPASSNKISLTIMFIGEGTTRDPFANIGRAEAELTQDEEFECTVTNKSGRALYISILDLSTDGSVGVIYPYPEGASELLPAGDSVKKRYKAIMPEERESVTDVIKVFATSSPVDFHFLAQPAVRGGTRGDVPQNLKDPLGGLLAQAALGITRGAKPSSVELGSWATAMSVFKIKR